jgi:hypothetical protein
MYNQRRLWNNQTFRPWKHKRAAVYVSEVVSVLAREVYRGSEGVHPFILNNFGLLGSAFLVLMQGYTKRRGRMVFGEVQGSDLHTEFICPERVFHSSRHFRINCQSGQDCFIAHSSKFIIRWACYFPSLCILGYWQRRSITNTQAPWCLDTHILVFDEAWWW